MNVYVYKAELLCEDCGEKTCRKLKREGKAPKDLSDERNWDSGSYPKGPYDNGGDGADSAQHCDMCNVFLENDLTQEGVQSVREAIARARQKSPAQQKKSVALTEWLPYYKRAGYDIEPKEELEGRKCPPGRRTVRGSCIRKVR